MYVSSLACICLSLPNVFLLTNFPDYKFPKALERLEELKRGPGKGRSAGKLSRKDQKHDEAECVVM